MKFLKKNKTDKELKKILERFDENELHGLMFGLIPAEKVPEDISGEDVARLMRMNPKGHY